MSLNKSVKVRSGGIYRQPRREAQAIYREVEFQGKSLVDFNLIKYLAQGLEIERIPKNKDGSVSKNLT